MQKQFIFPIAHCIYIHSIHTSDYRFSICLGFFQKLTIISWCESPFFPIRVEPSTEFSSIKSWVGFQFLEGLLGKRV